MEIKHDHFRVLKNSKVLEGSWAGRIPLNWFKSLGGYAKFNQQFDLSNKILNRSNLFEMSENKEISTLSCCISILAWGGMKKNHGESLFNKSLDWLKVADEIRHGALDRVSAYEKFSMLRADKNLPGMGPAYFTKLIFFLLPGNPRGYIMDQWTASSVNLVFDKKIIKI